MTVCTDSRLSERNSLRNLYRNECGRVKRKMVDPTRFERATSCLQSRHSSQLSYGPEMVETGGNRIRDLPLAKRPLCQLSYCPILKLLLIVRIMRTITSILGNQQGVQSAAPLIRPHPHDGSPDRI